LRSLGAEVICENAKPRRIGRLSRTIRADGVPSGVQVASVIAWAGRAGGNRFIEPEHELTDRIGTTSASKACAAGIGLSATDRARVYSMDRTSA